jgi:DnaJ-like protein
MQSVQARRVSSACAAILLQAPVPDGTMGQLMSTRRAILDGLARILDAEAPEELFTGPEADAVFLHGLLVEAARARRSSYYWEICRTARRRGVTPEYVIDRAIVLIATMEERRRADLYRILGVPPLSSGDTIRDHWLEVAKRHHPDVGGDGARFRQAKQAYEILRDPARRAEYERFWLRALGPFERVTVRDDVPRLDAPSALHARRPAAEPPAPRSAEALARPAAPAPEPAMPAGMDGIATLAARAQALLAPIRRDELARLQAEVARSIAQLEAVRSRLAALAAVKEALGA